MKMSLVVDGLRSDVVAVGELGDEVVGQVAERIADVLGRSVPGRILDVLSDAAAELAATLPGGRVDVRVAGDDVELTYVEDEPGPAAAPTGEGDEQSARISLRLGEGLKARLEAGAAAEGVSVNTFIVRTLERGSRATGAGATGRAIACTATARPEGADMEKTFETPGGVRLSVENHAGLVVVTAGAVDRTVVSLVADKPGAEELVEPPASSAGRRASDHVVEVKLPRVYGMRLLRSNSVTVRVEVPEGAQVAVATASADVEINGPVSEVDFKTASGNASIDDVAADVTTKTASGNVTIGRVGGDIRASDRLGRPALLERGRRRPLLGHVGRPGAGCGRAPGRGQGDLRPGAPRRAGGGRPTSRTSRGTCGCWRWARAGCRCAPSRATWPSAWSRASRSTSTSRRRRAGALRHPAARRARWAWRRPRGPGGPQRPQRLGQRRDRACARARGLTGG